MPMPFEFRDAGLCLLATENLSRNPIGEIVPFLLRLLGAGPPFDVEVHSRTPRGLLFGKLGFEGADEIRQTLPTHLGFQAIPMFDMSETASRPVPYLNGLFTITALKRGGIRGGGDNA